MLIEYFFSKEKKTGNNGVPNLVLWSQTRPQAKIPFSITLEPYILKHGVREKGGGGKDSPFGPLVHSTHLLKRKAFTTHPPFSSLV